MKNFMLLAALLLLSAGVAQAAPQTEVAPHVLVTDRGCNNLGCTTFELTAQKPLLLEFYDVTMTDDGTLHPDIRRQWVELAAGEGCQLTMTVSETMPNLMVCANHLCWTPAYSGMDGSLLLSSGFAAQGSSAPHPHLTTFVNFCLQ